VSYLWSFSTFNADRLVALFSDPGGEATARLVELTGWDGAGFDDAGFAASVAASFVASGLSYEGLDSRTTGVADAVVMLIFSPEGFERELEEEHLSDEGVHPLEIKELLSRAPDARVLPVLVSGRRAGQEEPSRCEYCILSPDEVAGLLDEIETALAADRPWPTEDGRKTVEAYLRPPLQVAHAEGRWVYAQLS